MTSLLVRARHVLQAIASDGAVQVIEDAGLLIRDGLIAEAAPWPGLSDNHPDVPVIGGPGAIVLPGLVNAHRRAGHDQARPGVAAIVRMATEGGACTTGVKDGIGRLDSGHAADLFVLDGAALAGGYLDPDTALVDAVLHRAKPAHVTDVLVAGGAVKRCGRLTHADPDAVRAELEEALPAPPSEEEADRRRMARGLYPHLRRFYADWPLPPAPFNLQ